MKEAPIPENEELRLKDLYSFDILDSESEEAFNDLVELVSQICDCPIATIAFIDRDRQWFKASKNINGTETDRETSFCSHAILQKEVLIVEDVSADIRFTGNPHTTNLKIGFYAGAPITSSNGYTIGAVCAIDNKPKELTPRQVKSLELVARQVSKLLDLRLRNKQITESAKLLVEAEKKIAQLNIRDQEEVNFKTAFLLHEEIAQAVAAIRFYVDSAKSIKALSDDYLEQSVLELTNLTSSIRGLSTSITPTTIADGEYVEHIKKLVEEFREQTNMKVTFHCSEDVTCLQGQFGLMVFRIIQDLFRLARYSSNTPVLCSVSCSHDLEVRFAYGGMDKLPANEKSMLEGNIINRVEMLKGTMDVNSQVAPLHRSEVNISIPVETAA